jgi:hypothetical protein
MKAAFRIEMLAESRPMTFDAEHDVTSPVLAGWGDKETTPTLTPNEPNG